MIGRLTGTLVEKNPPQLLLDVQGVAYEVDVPMSTFYNLPAIGERIVLFTHLVVREDAHLLFGFGTEHERRAFRQLVKISGVGARTALSVLSGLSVAELAQAVTMHMFGPCKPNSIEIKPLAMLLINMGMVNAETRDGPLLTRALC